MNVKPRKYNEKNDLCKKIMEVIISGGNGYKRGVGHDTEIKVCL